MTTTPLYTEAEIAEEIAGWKAVIRALQTSAEEYSVRLPDGSQISGRRVDLPKIEARLEKLQAMRVQNSTGSGPQFIQGRVYRG